MFLLLLLLSLAALAGWLLLAPNPKPIFGKYQQRGPRFYLKYFIFRIILWLRKRRAPVIDGDVDPLLEKDHWLPLSDHPLAFDAVFFTGSTPDGHYIVISTERRQHGVVNGPLYIRIPGVGLLRYKRMPDTVHFGATDGVYGAEGMSIQSVVPLRKWKIDYDGLMSLADDPSREFMVRLSGEWSSAHPAFSFDLHQDPHALARTIATEPWSREYFETLKTAHQNHYEQAGTLTVSLEVDGKKERLVFDALRDHSFGESRDWNLLHRFANFFIFLEDGTRAGVYVINQPCTCSRMEAGFVLTPSGEQHPVVWTDLQLYQHGEGGHPPTDMAFTFSAGGREYRVQVRQVDLGVHYVGWRWEGKVFERFVEYDVNGIPGRGVSEFSYNHQGGRDPGASASDPVWFKNVLRETYGTE